MNNEQDSFFKYAIFIRVARNKMKSAIFTVIMFQMMEKKWRAVWYVEIAPPDFTTASSRAKDARDSSRGASATSVCIDARVTEIVWCRESRETDVSFVVC